MLSESEIKEIKKQLKVCESGYSAVTRPAFRYLIKIASREIGGNLGKVTCDTCRRFTVNWLNKEIKKK